MLNDPFSCSSISDGQYKVTMNLIELGMASPEILTFKRRLYEIGREDREFEKICSLDEHVFKYLSESIFPIADKINNSKKARVMIIFGNPAINSVVKGLFFYERQDGNRHQLWGKLEKAGLLLKEIRGKVCNRGIEANRIKETILKGSTSPDYLLGLTTFYSFPTPVKPPKKEDSTKWRYGDVDGAETLFRAILPSLRQKEISRLADYDFGKGAIWVCTQKSSYDCLLNIEDNSEILYSKLVYWPIRGPGSGGDDLRKILDNYI